MTLELEAETIGSVPSLKNGVPHQVQLWAFDAILHVSKVHHRTSCSQIDFPFCMGYAERELGFEEMSDFVNYNKRAVDLPPGCKDLIDLLKPVGSSTGPLSDLHKHVDNLFASTALSFDLFISLPHERLSATLRKTVQMGVDVSVAVEEKSNEETLVRKFLSERGFQPPRESIISWTPIPNIPVYLLVHLSPLPATPEAIARLIADLLRQSGVPDDMAITYVCREEVESL